MRHAVRLTAEEIADHLSGCPGDLCDLVLHVRRFVLRVAPEVDEAIKFNALSYYLPGSQYGSIGGNVCMIECRKGSVELTFIHGASLPDPEALLQGSAKAKRRVRIRGLADARQPALHALIRAAVDRL